MTLEFIRVVERDGEERIQGLEWHGFMILSYYVARTLVGDDSGLR
jgi:hypothetical protein